VINITTKTTIVSNKSIEYVVETQIFCVRLVVVELSQKLFLKMC